MLPDFLSAAVILLASASVGLRVLEVFGAQKGMQALEKLLYSLGLGVPLLSLAVLAMGFFIPGSFSFPWFVGLLAVAIAASFPSFLELLDCMRQCTVELFSLLREGFSNPFSTEGICVIAIVAFVLLGFLSALAPAASYSLGPIDVDSLGYHLAVPKLYLMHQGIFFMEDKPQSNWPFGTEMLFALAMGLSSQVGAKLVAFGLTVALLAAIYFLAKKVLATHEMSVAAVAIFLSSQVVFTSLGSGAVDAILAFFFLLGVLSLLEWKEGGKLGQLVLSAFFAGAVAGSKLNGLLAIPVLFLAFAYALLAPAMTKRKLSSKELMTAVWLLVAFGLVSLAVVAPWFLKTYSFTGNPVWPLYSPIFGKLGFSDNGAASWTLAVNSFTPGTVNQAGIAKNITNFLLSPFLLTFLSRQYQFNGLVTPLLLALVPLAFIFRRPKHLDLLLALALIFYVGWFFSLQSTRYIVPALPLFSIVAAFSLAALKESAVGLRFRPLALAPPVLLSLVLLASFAFAFLYQLNAMPVALGLETQQSYLLRSQYNYAADQWANANLPADAKILLVDDNEGLYLDRNYLLATNFFYVHSVEKMSVYQFRQLLAAKGVTHVIVYTSVPFSSNSIYPQKIEPLVNGLLANSTLLYSANGEKVYAIS